jgi:transcription elongation GreA/GreB family factor/very-short-patch-repair endonuclease
MIADRDRKQAQTATQYEQRFNVALSRARDRMVLVRSVTEADLKPDDLKARVLRHFASPMPAPADASAALIDLCQSSFERDLFTVLVERGYRVVPQVGSEGFSIDMVVEGDAGHRLAIECDGDLYHGPERWADDMRRQRILERVGWTFWRCFGSNYLLDREGILNDLFETLERMGIKPVGAASASVKYTEHRTVRAKRDDDSADAAEKAHGSITQPAPDDVPEAEAESRLAAGDRVVVKYLDDPKARQECYLMTNGPSDKINGLLSLTSPLALALSNASPDDEVTVQLGDRESRILYLSVERETRKAA